jgi:hypothetical protein
LGALGGGGDHGVSGEGEGAAEGAGAAGVEIRLEGSGAGADSAGRGCVTGIGRAAVAARAGDDATWSGNSGSVGGVGTSGRGEAGKSSQDDGGVGAEETAVVIGVVGGVVACGVAICGVAGAYSGERSSSLSSLWSLSNSALFRLRLVLLAGGVRISGDEGVGNVWGGVERANSGGSPPTAATGREEGCAGSSRAALAVCPRLRLQRQRLPAALSVTAGTGMLHETVRTWHPAVWLIITRAFKPLAMQH